MGCFSPFPHGTGSLSVSHEYLALADGPAGFTQDFSCPALLRCRPDYQPPSLMGLSPAMAGLSSPSGSQVNNTTDGPTTPATPQRCGFGLFPGRSPLLGESFLFSLPAATKMFQFAAFASPNDKGIPHSWWVVPFGDPGLNGYLRLNRDFRSLSRPSSPVGA